MGEQNDDAALDIDATEAALADLFERLQEARQIQALYPLLAAEKSVDACVDLIAKLPPFWEEGLASPLMELQMALRDRINGGSERQQSRILKRQNDLHVDGDRKPGAPPACSALNYAKAVAGIGIRALTEPGPGKHSLKEAFQIVNRCVQPYAEVFRPSEHGYKGRETLRSWWEDFSGSSPKAGKGTLRRGVFERLVKEAEGGWSGPNTKEARARVVRETVTGNLAQCFGPPPEKPDLDHA